MFPAAALPLAFVLATSALLPHQSPEPQPPPVKAEFPCDNDGVIRCSADQVEVTSPRSLEDMRVIGKYIQLISERNRRQYLAWRTQSPSAAFELVRRVKSFPYVPYNDSYSIVGLEIVLSQSRNLIFVRYPRKPKENTTTRIPDDGFIVYSTKLSTFIETLQKEIGKLKKYEK